PIVPCWAVPDMLRSQSVRRSQVWGEVALDGSHRGLSGHIRHGQSAMESIEAGNLFGKSLKVHLPSRSSFSRRMSPLISSFNDILEPSRLVAPSSCHRSD